MSYQREVYYCHNRTPLTKDKGVVIDGNTIYEIDMSCYECLSDEERERYFGEGYRSRNQKPCYKPG
ncbi:MAG: hypothetical protein LBR68_06260 [Lachnoclostridium sp.]|jgi:hypothetical protein|nr:hypothetical protein [Lachnoclostridium sp.]